jgi:hypothetical protein
MKKIFNIILLSSLLALSLIVSISNVKLGSAADHPGPYFKVEPETVTFGPESAIGQLFNVTIMLYNVTSDNTPAGLQGVEVKLTYDNTILNITRRWHKLGADGGVLNPDVLIAKNELGPGYYWLAGASTGDPWWGNGTVAILEFNVTYQGWWYQGKSCELKLSYTELRDNDNKIVNHEVEHGYYEILGLNPSPMPSIKVVPSTVTKGPTYAINDTFTVAVKIYDVDPAGLPSPYGIYGIEVHMTWNDTLIKPVSYQQFIGNTTVGVLNEPVFFVYDDLTDSSYKIAVTSLPPAEPWNGTDKTIFEITFRVALQKVEPYPDLSCALDINFTDVQMLPDDAFTAVFVPHTVEDGTYTINQFPETNYYTVTWDTTEYVVAIESDSLINAPDNLDFNPNTKSISFNVTTSDGFCNVTIPKSLMKSDPLSAWVISIDGSNVTEPNRSITENTTHTFLWFNFTEGTHVIVITSTWVIPEFTSMTIILTLMTIITTVAAATKILKRKAYCN